MASVYKTPGVYVEEIPTLPPSIAEVETAIPSFIGYTETASFNGQSLLNKPTRISSLLEYQSLFGYAQKESAIQVTIADVMSGSVLVSRSITADVAATSKSKFTMFYALQMYFANGGGPCYIVSVGIYSTNVSDTPGTVQVTPTVSVTEKNAPEYADLKAGLDESGKYDEPTIIVIPDATNLADPNNYHTLMHDALVQCKLLQDRVTIIDVLPNSSGPNPIISAVEAFRNAAPLGSNIDELKYGAAYYPYLKTTLNYRFDETAININYIVNGTASTIDTDAGTGGNQPLTVLQIKTPGSITLGDPIRTGLGMDKSGAVAPNIELYNKIKTELNKLTLILPPSSAVAGVYASVDSSRGVWKAPANVSLGNVIETTIKISNPDQENMNVDATSGKSVNAIRYFTGKGVLVWGARTLAGNDNEWRYIPVRRFFNYAEESIKKGTHWVVFEPNDANTWVRVKGMIESFLIKQWRAGALAGAKPEHAFYVKIGLGVTMTALDILEGRMNIEIGMAVVRPAEFIILKFSHKLQES